MTTQRNTAVASTPLAKSPPPTAHDETTLALRNAAMLLVSLAGTLAVAVAVRIWMPRFLGPDSFGVLHFAEELAAACLFFTTLGIDTYIKRDVATNPAHASDFFGGLLQVRLLVTLAVNLMMAGLLTLMHKPAIAWQVAFIFAGGQVVFVLNTTFASMLQAVGTVRELAIINVSGKLLWGGSVVAGLALGGGLRSVATSFVIAELAKAPFLYGSCRRHLGLMINFQPRAAFTVLGLSLPYYLNYLAHELYARTGVAMLSSLSNDAEVGWYGAASQVKTLLLLALPIINAVVLPMGARIARQSTTTLNETMRGTVRMVLSLATPLAMLLAFNAGDLVLLLFTANFMPAATELRVLMLIIPLACFCVLAAMHLLQLGKIWTVTRVSVISFLFNIAATPVLIHYGARLFGVGGAGIGAAVATVLTEAFVAVLLLLALGPAGADRRLWGLLVRLVALAGVLALAHLLLSPLRIWRLPLEAGLLLVAGHLLGAIPIAMIGSRLRTLFAQRGLSR